MNPTGPLLPADEAFCHQIPETFSVVAASDPSWTEKVCAMAAAKDGSIQLGFGLGKYTNRNVMDGYAAVSRGLEQTTVRASRRLAPDPERTVTGPIRYEVLEPMRAVRFVLEANDCQPIAFDWLFEAIVPPFLEERTKLFDQYRSSAELLRYHQTGVASGWVEIDGERTVLSNDAWVSTRDHSWGVRYDVGLPPTDVAPRGDIATTPGATFQMIWSPIAMERPDGSRYALFLHYMFFNAPVSERRVVTGDVEDSDGRLEPWTGLSAAVSERRVVMGGVEESDGRMEQWAGLEPELSFDPDNRRLRGGRIVATMADGSRPRARHRGGVRHRRASRRRTLFRLRRPPPRRMAR